MRRVPALLAVIVLGVCLLATAAHAAGSPQGAPAPGRVALIGVPGLHWNDIGPRRTPNLWRLAQGSAIGTLSPRAVATATCPYDGWLTVSAGIRTSTGGRCGVPPVPEPAGGGAVVPGFDRLRGDGGRYSAGALGAAARAAGHCTAAVGPGAALALADADGRVDVYAATPDALPDAGWSRCPLLAVDVDDLIRPYLRDGVLTKEPDLLSPAERAAAVAAADAKVGAVLERLPADTAVLLAGLSDHGGVPHLRVAMWRTPGGTGRLVGTASTHRDHIVLLPDITATMLVQAGVEVPAVVIGAPWRLTAAAPLEEALDIVRRADLRGQTVRNATRFFFYGVAALQVLFYVAAFVLLRRRRALGGVRVAAVALASIPIATSLANLFPWDRTAAPTATLIGCVAAIVVLLAVAALAGPWRRHPFGPAAVVTGVTAAVLLGDMLTGTTLQIDGLMGYTAVVGGRYHGLGNVSFALLATSVLLLAAAGAERLVTAGRPRAAVGFIAGCGGVAMLLDGWPGIGSDFGGVIAFLPGIAVTALLVAGARVSIVRLGGFCAAGGVLIMAIAFLDHLRPPADQTHLGRFVGQVADGTYLPVIARKLDAMLQTMLNPNLMPIVVTALGFLVFAVLRPGTVSAGLVPLAFERSPMLKAGLVGSLVCGVVGTLVNDSGVAVLSMVLGLAVPLVLATGIGMLRENGRLAPIGPAGEASPGPSDGPSGGREGSPGTAHRAPCDKPATDSSGRAEGLPGLI
ncbi:hypothetical protein GCM10010106_44190 [Thermopolyspora flexuosa]|uniref:Phosphoglyceromutase n=1 Tax=Thermopolyspora flexuosa TaxID=103836 RepID=A0A543IX97_9ACTN|nr:hypothetical protein FHX40_1900 [Thermopolyspora flexuosa]GGM91502.1 hypothetical protein GCM10010106_44190 [Thermopolyspora flexuosa]